VSSTKEGVQTVKLVNKLFDGFGVSIDEMYEIALENTMRLFPVSIRYMNEIILSMLKSEMGETEDLQLLKDLAIPTGEEPRMYVLSNTTGINGATTLLYSNVLKEFADKAGRDLFILPSSLHEIILVPIVSRDFKVEDLRSMVNEVNQNNVPIEDILSNSVYQYNRKENSIERL
jgi:replication initiation and membrane attachment protein DnaB